MDKLLKKVELNLKKILNRFITCNRRRYSLKHINNVFYFNNTPKILLLRHDRIGDLLISTSFIKILRKNYLNAEIDILLSKKNYTAKNCIAKYVNKIWVLENNAIKYLLLLKKLNIQKYDLIIDLLDSSSTTAGVIIKYANPTFALGIDKHNAYIYDYTVPMLDRFNTNIVERTCNLLIAFGINPIEQDLNLEYPFLVNSKTEIYNSNHIKNYTKKNRIGINLAGSNINRFWGKENNLALIKHLSENYPEIEIRLFYTIQYANIAAELAETNRDLLIGLCDSFDDFVYEVSLCDYIISPDTSIVHIVSIFKIPALIMYIADKNSPHSPWYPYKSEYKALIATDETLATVSQQEVINEVDIAIKKYKLV